MKVVINACYGGFNLSDMAVKRYAELKGITLYPVKEQFNIVTYWLVPQDKRIDMSKFYALSMEERKALNDGYYTQTLNSRNIERNDPLLIQVVEEMGDQANGDCAKLKIVEIPDGVQWEIEEYDGNEHIAEAHRAWR